MTLDSGLRQFKALLDSILYSADEDATARQREILKEFLLSEKPDDDDEDGVYLSSLFQTWSFASQTSNDHLISAVSALIAQLLKAASTDIDLREHGLGVCRSVLQLPNAKLVSWSLSAPKHKEFVISPALRLLTEVVSFDGGSLARHLYSRRDLTFDAQVLSRNLSLRRTFEEKGDDHRARPTIRSNAVRYLLANLKFQNEGVKADILQQFHLIRSLFDGIQDDSPLLIAEILGSLKSTVIQDGRLSRTVKGRVFNDRNLNSLAQLYRANHLVEPEEGKESVIDMAHEFMLLVCTQFEAGVLQSSSGWYPPRKDVNIAEQDFENDGDVRVDLRLDSVDDLAPQAIRNWTLSEFIQTLRPYKSNHERELFLAILGAAPELVANYFQLRKSFAFDPKLTVTWIGYASTLFEVIQLPIPNFFGRRDSYGETPPPLATVMENLLPQPLTQKVLTNCLNQVSSLIRLFAIRIIVIAFQKLRDVLQCFRQAAIGGAAKIWETAASRLVSEFGRRCPKINDVVVAFRKTNKENLLESEAVTRLLSLYYEITPQVALDAKFDTSVALASALQGFDNSRSSNEEDGFKSLELDHLLLIARQSPGISWWKKPDALQYTPFLTLANLASNNLIQSGVIGSTELNGLLVAIIRDCGLFHMASDEFACRAFLQSLSTLRQERLALEFIDDCLQRTIRRPIKYEDDLDALITRVQGKLPSSRPRFSLLLMTLVEQWPYVEKTKQAAARSIAKWLCHMIFYLRQIGEDPGLLNAVVEELAAAAPDGAVKAILRSSLTTFTPTVELVNSIEPSNKPSSREIKATSTRLISKEAASFDISVLSPPALDPKNTALTKWSNKDVTTVIEEGGLASLILLLSSSEPSIRLQARNALQRFSAKLQQSHHPERTQLYLLIGETLETASPFLSPTDGTPSTPLPSIASTLAARAVPVLADPSHPLYAKLNGFLNRGPAWSVPGLARHWCALTLLAPPDEPASAAADADAALWREAAWVLAWMADGVRGPADVEVLRRGAVFERVMALFAHPALRPFRRVDVGEGAERTAGSVVSRIRSLVLRLIGRVALVEGGATTLVTRAGVLAWLDVVVTSGWVDDAAKAVVAAIREAVLQRCDRARVAEWSSGTLVEEMSKLSSA